MGVVIGNSGGQKRRKRSYMIRISQLKLSVNHSEEDLKKKAAKMLKLQPADIRRVTVVKQSVDARKKSSEVLFIYTVAVEVAKEDKVLHRVNSPNIAKAEKKEYQFPEPGTERLEHRPVIIGSGPAGLFCALMLARAGFGPIVFERGERVEERKRSVLQFWQGGELKSNSNVQFGEGGAGTFSDGKLNTLVKDPLMRNRKVLEVFVEFGADPSILYKNKPHIGTDVLSVIVKNMREEIIRLGGTFYFQSCVTDFRIKDGALKAITVNGTEEFETDVTVLAVGHSARDTFERLLERSVPIEKKAFAVGLRIQHPQRDINAAQYGAAEIEALGAADYKVTHQCANGRGVYSFCMCPGGYVVDASSEPGRLAVNGMSYHARDGVNANSALIVTVTPQDFPEDSPLAGIAYQRRLEEAAYRCGGGKIPVQLYRDFKKKRATTAFGDVEPAFEGRYAMANLREFFPDILSESLIEGVEAFNGRIAGFSRGDAILAGVESRTSSPVRIPRDERFESSIKGIYPCGEGAGYAGGITSAAMDGIKTAEAVAARFSVPT